jgi:hypothetical protein
MKKSICAMMIGAAAVLGSTVTTHAMSELISLSTAPMWPVSSTPDNNIVYYVTTVGRAGSGLLEVALTADDLPAGVTVTFSPEVLRFTGTKVESKTAKMTVHCPSLMPVDCYPFTLTGTAQRESLTITNVVMITPAAIASRPPTLYIDDLGQRNLRVRGLGATGKTYEIQSRPEVDDGVWQPQGESTADGNGRFTFFTTNCVDLSTCHFRAVLSGSGPVPQ